MTILLNSKSSQVLHVAVVKTTDRCTGAGPRVEGGGDDGAEH